jgi:hypothetical protein
VLDSQTDRRFSNSVCYSLCVVLAAVNADDDELVGEFFFELPQLRKNVNAVDSTIRPEIEQHDLSPQVDEPKRLVPRMNPVQIRWEFRRSNGGGFLKISCHGV